MRAYAAVAIVAAAVLAAAAGCHRPEQMPEPIPRVRKNYEAQLPPGVLALRKITDPREIPDFTRACADTAGLREAVAHSLNYLAKPSSRAHFPYGEITHEQAVATLRAFADPGVSPKLEGFLS